LPNKRNAYVPEQAQNLA